MKPLGLRAPVRRTVEGHQDCGICHPPTGPNRALEKRRAAKDADPDNDVYEAEYRKCSAYPDCEVCGPAAVEEDDD